MRFSNLMEAVSATVPEFISGRAKAAFSRAFKRRYNYSARYLRKEIWKHGTDSGGTFTQGLKPL